MKFARFVCVLIPFAITTVLAQTNPVPFVNQPLVPTAVAPGGAGFTLTVNGTGFVSTSTINWNGTPLATTFVNSSQLTATVPAANITKASTASITVSSPGPGGGISNVLSLPISAPTTLQFASFPATAANGCAPCFNLITGDFNRDGKLDLTFDVFYIGPALTTSLGNGDGTFQKALGAVFGFDFSVAADFNGDGKLDMAGIEQSFGPYQPYSAYIALGNGDGTFSPSSTIASGNQSDDLTAFQIAAADFNGDGKLDVAIGDDLGIEVYLGNGDGTFQAGLPPVGGGVAHGQAVGDFNEDGILDIAEIVDTSSNLRLQILLVNT
jgi:large repetitive protein